MGYGVKIKKMSLAKRLRNLWLLSNFEITPNEKGGVDVFITKAPGMEIKETPKMAQIIKMKNPVDSFLEK